MDVAAHWAMAAEEVRRAVVQRCRGEADPEAPGVLGGQDRQIFGKGGAESATQESRAQVGG